MELDLWNEYLFQAGDWASSPADHFGGLCDDLKPDSCLCGNDPLSLQLQDAVECVKREPPSIYEDVLGLEWMESSDLGSLLEVFSSQESLLPLEASLADYNTLPTAPEEPAATPVLAVSASFLLDQLVTTHEGQAGLDLSPPSSPEQVTPVINIASAKSNRLSKPVSINSVSNGVFRTVFIQNDVEESLVLGDFEQSPGASCEESIVTSDSFVESPLLVDDVDSLLSTSSPSSPSTISQSSLIESSPELYRIIVASPSKNNFSPYPKSKPGKQAKATDRKRLAAEPVPEYVIAEQLSKKDRKKLQNKNAAIRYRMKKKEEAVGIKTEEQILEDINQELRTKVDDLQREIRYMKNLMEDVCRAKGLI